MEKKDKPMYTSRKILGQLYRELASVPCSLLSERKVSKVFDPDLIIENFEEHLDDAKQYRDQYNNELFLLMKQFDFANEAEVISGQIIHTPRHYKMKQNNTDVQQRVMETVHAMRKRYRQIFLDGLKGSNQKEKDADALRKASAWYYVTYHPSMMRSPQAAASTTSSGATDAKVLKTKQQGQKQPQLKESDGRGDQDNLDEVKTSPYDDNDADEKENLVSFPWIVWDKLVRIKQNAMKARGQQQQQQPKKQLRPNEPTEVQQQGEQDHRTKGRREENDHHNAAATTITKNYNNNINLCNSTNVKRDDGRCAVEPPSRHSVAPATTTRWQRYEHNQQHRQQQQQQQQDQREFARAEEPHHTVENTPLEEQDIVLAWSKGADAKDFFL
eukprot:GEZU01019645.1.p1 GENE.GEZU01019645.1~~GEZU01019645.1.p1  ORF type:complete len:386 (+),score=129.00 GEZU01019645.1:194-1351(+)